MICSVEGCQKPYCAKGWCKRHYQYFQRKGIAPTVRLTTQGLPLAERMQAFFTETPDCWTWKGALSDGYGQIKVSGKMRRSHVVMYEMSFGPVPEGMLVDHRCRRRHCVRPSHLRLATTKQNLENLSGANRNNRTSGIRGVHWHKASSRWIAQVCHNYRRHHVGLFRTVEEAEAAVIAKRNELFTHNDLDRMAS